MRYKEFNSKKVLDTDTCEITWACTFNTNPATEAGIIGLFEGFYKVIIESLGEMLLEK